MPKIVISEDGVPRVETKLTIHLSPIEKHVATLMAKREGLSLLEWLNTLTEKVVHRKINRELEP